MDAFPQRDIGGSAICHQMVQYAEIGPIELLGGGFVHFAPLLLNKTIILAS
jgi:hypothetical protein